MVWKNLLGTPTDVLMVAIEVVGLKKKKNTWQHSVNNCAMMIKTAKCMKTFPSLILLQIQFFIYYYLF